jgi:hypothetical protein
LPGAAGISKPKYGESREMSQSVSLFSPSLPSHSCILLAASFCSRPSPRVQRRRKDWQRGSDNRKKKCSDCRSSGRAPETAEYGFFSSLAVYAAPQLSQLSPYWSCAPHFGHSPLMKRSGRNICFTGS